MHCGDADINGACIGQRECAGERDGARGDSAGIGGAEFDGVFVLPLRTEDYRTDFTGDRPWDLADYRVRAALHWSADHGEWRADIAKGGAEELGAPQAPKRKQFLSGLAARVNSCPSRFMLLRRLV